MQPTSTTAPTPTWGVRAVLIVALPLLALTLISQFTSTSATDAPAIPVRVSPIITTIILNVFEAALILPVWLLAVVKAHGNWRAVGFRRFSATLGCTLPLIYLLVAFFGSALWDAVIRLMHWQTQQELTPIFGSNVIAIALGFVAVSIVAPIAEETLFRGFVIGGLRQRFGVMGALIASAVFFALLHPPLTIFPIIFTLGILLGLLFVQTGSLWPGILMHAAFNTLGFIAQFALTAQ